MKKPHPARALVQQFHADLAALLEEETSEGLTASARKKLIEEAHEIQAQLAKLLRAVDPVKLPASVFDPSEPKLVGLFTALAMVAQPEIPLDTVERFYGSGIYALYYRGDFPLYDPIKNKETPVYVGKADPASGSAKTPVQQGERLAHRLRDHRLNINKVDNLDIDDFTCRALVVQSGWQTAAESYLINLFKPIWNKEIGLVYGFGKHGDAASTRSNKRAPWDTLHQGRGWAGTDILEDAKTLDKIETEVSNHLSTVTVFDDLEVVLEAFVTELRQRTLDGTVT